MKIVPYELNVIDNDVDVRLRDLVQNAQIREELRLVTDDDSLSHSANSSFVTRSAPSASIAASALALIVRTSASLSAETNRCGSKVPPVPRYRLAPRSARTR